MQNLNIENPPISRLLRMFTLVEFFVLLTAGGGLFFVPDFFTSLWAWTLTPFNTRFLGAVYLASMTAIGLMVFKGRWSPARPVLRVIFSFTLIVLIVSVLYYTRFNFQQASTWVWFALYIALPANAAYHLWLYRDMPTTHLSAVPALWSNILRIVGVLSLAYGIGLLVLPETFSGFWAWTLDDFHSRLYSATFISGGIGALTVASKTDGWELISAGLTQVVLGLLAIIGLLWVDVGLQRVNWAEAGTWLWMAIFGAFVLVGSAIVFAGTRRLEKTS